MDKSLSTNFGHWYILDKGACLILDVGVSELPPLTRFNCTCRLRAVLKEMISSIGFNDRINIIYKTLY